MTSADNLSLSRREHLIVGAMWAALTVLFILLNRHAIASMSLPDSDDYLRLQQVRDWLAGQSWFDVTQHRINPPDGGILHWSRLVDIPIALGILALKPLIGQASAELVVALALPAITMALAMWLVAAITAKLVNRTWAPLAAATVPLSALIYTQIMPLRIDHHGWQMVMALVVFWALLDEAHKRRGGIIAGIAAACWLNISLEGFPVITCAAAVLGVRWLLDGREAPRLQAYLWALTLTSFTLETLTMPRAWIAVECDRVSQPYFFAFAIASAASLSLQAKLFVDLRMRAVFGVVVGAAVAGAFFTGGAQCFAGPFRDLEPIVRTLWLDKVGESKPLIERGIGAFIASGGFWLVALIGAIQATRTATGEQRLRWITALTLITASGALMFILSRTGAVAHAFAAPAAAFAGYALFTRARAIQFMPTRTVLTALALAIATPALLRPALQLDAATHMVARGPSCTTDAATLAALPTSTLFTPIDMGAAVIVRSAHSVVATPHHRNHAAIGDVLNAFTAQPSEALARIQAHRASYVVMCPGSPDVRSYISAAPNGLAARLTEGQTVAGLTPVSIGGRSGLLIFAVDDAQQDDLRGRLALNETTP